MEKVFYPKTIEKKWYEEWEKSSSFKPSLDNDESFCTILPPPNITGSLHMGHAFQDSLMDALTRYNRMLGKNTLWQPGTDHASISTEMVVERQLNAKNSSKHDIGREEFLKKVWEWKELSGSTITSQMRRLGASADWSRECFTMDDTRSKSVIDVFVKLYREGLIYRGQKLVNWDPVMQTAVSDLEVISTEEQSSLWYFNYPINDSESITIATTRPETMLGDVAIAVNPNDERYSSLIGKEVSLPLTDRKIPVIADDYVDPEFGTGCVKITPAHDFNDNEIGKRHNLEQINILTPTATLNDNVPEKYQGLDRFEAREIIIKDMEALGLLEKIEPHTLKVPRGEKSSSVIEPLLTDQWFMKMEDLAAEAIKVVESGQVKFIPSNWSKTYYEWMNNIQDWCISRQIWWGHRIPSWKDDSNNIYVGYSEDEVREFYKLPESLSLTQDPDVLDTWFSSALWAFTSLDWPNDEVLMEKFFPTSVLVTGFDIIFFWVARMIMMSLKFIGKVPFKEVYIHGLIQDQDGQKMSKSKGNVIDPIDIIDGISLDALLEKRTHGLMQPRMKEKIIKSTKKQFPEGIPAFGTDALRFTFYSLATHGRHLCFDLDRTQGYRNFCNKIWNAARYIHMNLDGTEKAQLDVSNLSVVDSWILSHWEDTKKTIHKHFQQYRFDLLSSAIYEFVWHKFCDWYLELTKPTLYGKNEEEKVRTKQTMMFVLNEVLTCMHPLMPFITEEIWHLINPSTKDELLMNQSFPKSNDSLVNQVAVDEVDAIIGVIQILRNIKGEMNISPSKQIPLIVQSTKDNTLERILTKNSNLLRFLAKVEAVDTLEDGAKPPISASAFYMSTKILIPLKGLVDINAESERLNKSILKLEKDILKISKKLDNPNYREKAPADIVSLEEEKLRGLNEQQDKLKDSLALIENLN